MQLNHCIMYSLFTHKRICQHCGAEFVSQKSTTKYCSKRCANIAGKARNREYLLQLKQRSVTETRRQELMENPYLSLTQAAKLLQISMARNGSFRCGPYLFEQSHHQKSGKCENSAKNQPDYVKITPQNSTDYVKTAIFAVNNIRFATWIICLKER